jgi:hypothetical protein
VHSLPVETIVDRIVGRLLSQVDLNALFQRTKSSWLYGLSESPGSMRLARIKPMNGQYVYTTRVLRIISVLLSAGLGGIAHENVIAILQGTE